MFKVYSSSAGSGKTYTLTKEYLKLALHSNSEGYFRHVLAVTFTNAAANEMKERILLMLRTFSEWKPGVSDMPHMLRDVATELYPETGTDQTAFDEVCKLISLRAQLVFRQILHRYSDFSVMTIDKFTQRLISSFTDELGIPFVFETQLDGDLLDEAVDRLLARIGQEGEEILTEVVERYYQERAEEGFSWASLPAQIRDAASVLLTEQSYLQLQRIASLQMTDFIAIRKQLKDYVRDKEGEITALGIKAFDLIGAAALIDKDFFQAGRGIYGYFSNRAQGVKLWDDPNSYALKTIHENNWYGAKTPAPIKAGIDGIAQDLVAIFVEMEQLRASEKPKVLLYQQLHRHLYNLSLLGEIRKEFDMLLRQKGQVHISDFNKKIIDVVSNEPVPFIYERLGEKYNHILIDEFQDTSKLQFANLLPLVENALADGHFNLVVGDAKQSIYRFRGGDMDLILHLSQNQIMHLAAILGESDFNMERLGVLDNHLEVDHLRMNRRSFREVTTFNNDFFAFVADMLGDTSPVVKDIYNENFRQEIPPGAREGGHVQLEFLESIVAEDSDEPLTSDVILIRTAELIREMLLEGYGFRDLAILCRRKKEATAIAGALQESGYPVISDDALGLGYSRSVQFVISFMKVLHTPDNRLARYEAAYLFHQVIRQQNPDATEHEALRTLCQAYGLDTFLAYFARWGVELSAFRMRQLTVYETSEKLIQSFGLFRNLPENQYLFRFLDVVLDFGNRRASHLGDFLVYWEGVKHKLSITIPADTDAIRVTTIHKSKGLEYPVVIVPYANWNVTPNARLDRLWVDLEALPYAELGREESETKLNSSMVSVVKDLEGTLVENQYVEEKNRTLVENLNLLYVAFTRPIQRLYVLARQDKSRHGGAVNHWLYGFASRDETGGIGDPEQQKYIVADGSGPVFHAHKTDNREVYLLKDIISEDRSDRLHMRRMADRVFDVETFERKHDASQKLRYLLSRLRVASDLPAVVEALASEGIWTREEGRKAAKEAEKILETDDLRELYSGAVTVQTNKELLIPGGQMLHIDRIVRHPSGRTVFMSFVTPSEQGAAKKHLKKLLTAYASTGMTTEGVVLTPGSGAVEWVR